MSETLHGVKVSRDVYNISLSAFVTRFQHSGFSSSAHQTVRVSCAHIHRVTNTKLPEQQLLKLFKVRENDHKVRDGTPPPQPADTGLSLSNKSWLVPIKSESLLKTEKLQGSIANSVHWFLEQQTRIRIVYEN